MIPRILGALLLCLACAAQAGVYTYIDAEGNRVYTDQPPSGRKAQRVELAPGNSVAPPGIRYRPPAAPLEVKPPAYQLLRILFPEPDATLRANSGDVIVTVTSEPALLPGHRYRLLLDGKPAGVPGRSPVFPLKNLDRGTHQVAVEIIDGDGMTVESTPSQPFHLHRVSIAGNPCRRSIRRWSAR